MAGFTFSDLKTPSTVATSGIKHGINIPKASFPDTGIIAIGYTVTYDDVPALGNNIYIIGNFSQTTNSSFHGVANPLIGSLTGEQAVAVDKKLDDGVNDTGKVLPFQTGGAGFFNAPETNCTVTTDLCGIVIEMQGDK